MMKVLFFMILLNFLNYFLFYKFLMIFMFNLIFVLCMFFFLNFNNLNIWCSVYGWLGVDLISFSLIFLTILIFSLMFMSSVKFKNLKIYSFILLLLLMFLLLSFMSINYFMFYLFFEMSLFPIFMLIMGWGYQPERINASMHMLLYTLFASLPLLILLYYLFNYMNSLNYLIILNMFLKVKVNLLIIYIFMILAFLVKLPLFMFHLWLPKAHIEAPVTGSMILAAVLLKLGGYGCMRTLMIMLNLSKKFNYILLAFCIFGMIYLSMISMRCNDFKLIVAYSSVVHMGMMMMGLISMSMLGFLGGLVMMLGHGFCSSGLFFMVNLFYDNSKSRNLLLNKGMLIFMPSMCMIWFMFCVGNMAAPVTLNLFSEIFILMGILSYMFYIFPILMLGMYFSAMYSLYLFSYVSHGKNNMLIKFYSSKFIDFMNLLIHWIFLNLIVLKMEIFI